MTADPRCSHCQDRLTERDGGREVCRACRGVDDNHLVADNEETA